MGRGRPPKADLPLGESASWGSASELTSSGGHCSDQYASYWNAFYRPQTKLGDGSVLQVSVSIVGSAF